MCSYPYHDLRPEQAKRLDACRGRWWWHGLTIPSAEYCTFLLSSADEKMLAEVIAKPETDFA